MKAITKLEKILAMDDGVKKRAKLFEFCFECVPNTTYQERAFKEWCRLKNMTF